MATEIEGLIPGPIRPIFIDVEPRPPVAQLTFNDGPYYTAANTNTADLFAATDIVITQIVNPIVLNVEIPAPAEIATQPNQELISRNLQSLLSSRGVSLDNLDSRHREVLELGQELEGCVIAGGATLSLYRGTLDQIKDWDLFFDLDANRTEAEAKLLDMGFEKSAETEWSISYEKNGVVAQTIRFKNFNSVGAIFKSFDISVCCFAIEENHMTFTKQAQDDVENMSLNFLGTTNPVWCLNRIIKYAMKGFKLTNQSAVNFLLKAKEFSAPAIKKNGSTRAGATAGES